jgi:hypothetical protein
MGCRRTTSGDDSGKRSAVCRAASAAIRAVVWALAGAALGSRGRCAEGVSDWTSHGSSHVVARPCRRPRRLHHEARGRAAPYWLLNMDDEQERGTRRLLRDEVHASGGAESEIRPLLHPWKRSSERLATAFHAREHCSSSSHTGSEAAVGEAPAHWSIRRGAQASACASARRPRTARVLGSSSRSFHEGSGRFGRHRLRSDYPWGSLHRGLSRT